MIKGLRSILALVAAARAPPGTHRARHNAHLQAVVRAPVGPACTAGARTDRTTVRTATPGGAHHRCGSARHRAEWTAPGGLHRTSHFRCPGDELHPMNRIAAGVNGIVQAMNRIR
ncbi:hypothetical protein [Streptomyces sp. NPDC048641]|uniref:hypothetical protein n=1 Tax=Streptomyces sp. NPDC048641 TaxID=3154825 RepID=UPI0034174FDE